MLSSLSIHKACIASVIFQNFSILIFLNFDRYQVKETGFDYKEDVYGIVINFKENVQVKTSHWRMEPFTLIARIGGIIGVGQTISWLFVTSLEKLATIFMLGEKIDLF